MSKPKMHPLLAAVIAQLPAAGVRFPAASRVAWLKMMAQSFEMAYGPDAPIAVGLAGDQADGGAPLQIPLRAGPTPEAPPAKVERKAHQVYGVDVYVDEQGFARCDYRFEMRDDLPAPISIPTPGRRVTVEEAGDKEIYDYRGTSRDRSTVVWADDSVGALPGMVFCGPG